MRNTTILCEQYLRAFALIYLCLFAGNAISALLPLTIPGSIIGMLILFALLASQILPAPCKARLPFDDSLHGAAVCAYRRGRHELL